MRMRMRMRTLLVRKRRRWSDQRRKRWWWRRWWCWNRLRGRRNTSDFCLSPCSFFLSNLRLFCFFLFLFSSPAAATAPSPDFIFSLSFALTFFISLSSSFALFSLSRSFSFLFLSLSFFFLSLPPSSSSFIIIEVRLSLFNSWSHSFSVMKRRSSFWDFHSARNNRRKHFDQKTGTKWRTWNRSEKEEKSGGQKRKKNAKVSALRLVWFVLSDRSAMPWVCLFMVQDWLYLTNWLTAFGSSQSRREERREGKRKGREGCNVNTDLLQADMGERFVSFRRCREWNQIVRVEKERKSIAQNRREYSRERPRKGKGPTCSSPACVSWPPHLQINNEYCARPEQKHREEVRGNNIARPWGWQDRECQKSGFGRVQNRYPCCAFLVHQGHQWSGKKDAIEFISLEKNETDANCVKQKKVIKICSKRNENNRCWWTGEGRWENVQTPVSIKRKLILSIILSHPSP